MGDNSNVVKKKTFFQNLLSSFKNVSESTKGKKSYFPLVPSAKLKKDWSKWSRFHNEIEQCKRKVRVLDKKYTCVSINPHNGVGKFIGERDERYTTTLKKCNCVDFQRRSKPCKHMYHLASQLELINLASADDNFTQLTRTLKLLPDETLEIFAKLLKNHSTKGTKFFPLPVNEFTAPLLYRGYCIDNHLTESIIESLPVAITKEMLQATKLDSLPPMNSQKTTIIKWFNENIAKIANEVDKFYFIYELVPNIENSSGILYENIIEIQKYRKENPHR